MARSAVAEAAPVARERILAAAQRRFAAFGYRRTGIAEIAREAGVAAGTIYRYFESKEEVFRAVVGELHDAWLERAREALAGPGQVTAPPPSRAALPPGPRRPAFLQSLRYVRRPYEAVEESGRLFGNCFTARPLAQPPTVIFADPDAIKDIFMGDPEELRGGEGNAWLLGPILGWNSVLVLDGQRHFRERKLLLPPFHGERIHVYGRIIRDITDRVIDAWPVGRPFSVHHEMQAITLDVILRAVFGVDEGPELVRLRQCLLRVLALANTSAAAFLFIPLLRIDFGRFSPWGRFLRDRREFATTLLAQIARRREEGTAGRSDVLSMLVEHGEPMRDEELLDEMFTIL